MASPLTARMILEMESFTLKVGFSEASKTIIKKKNIYQEEKEHKFLAK